MRDVDEFLCRTCKRRIEAAKEAEEKAKRVGEELGDAGFMALQIPDPASDKVAGYDFLPIGMDWKTPEAGTVARSFCRMLLTMLPELPAMPTAPAQYGGSSFRSAHRDFKQGPVIPAGRIGEWPIIYRLGKPEDQRVIMDFWAAMRALFLAVHQHGIERGRDLLSQLAAGEITLNSLNDATTKGR